MNSEFMYDEETDELFRFHKDKQDWTQFNTILKPTKTYAYIKIRIDNKMFPLHRVIYSICNEEFDLFDSIFVIDHADRNTGNNKLSNLSIRTQSQNSQNRTGVKGISLQVHHCKTKESTLYFWVNWNKDKKLYRKRVKNYYLANWLRKTKTSHYYRGIN